MKHKNIAKLVVELLQDHKDANAPLVFEQLGALQEQYRHQYEVYKDDAGRLRQETFAYLIIKGNLEKGLYRERTY